MITYCFFQNVKNTSPPKKTKLMNMKNMNISSSLCSCCSLVSSLLLLFAPPAAPLPTLLEPKMSSHVKFNVNKAGNSPKPITNPFCLLPKKGFPP